MVRSRFEQDGPLLRDRILNLLQQSSTSVSEDVKALLQCVSHIRDRILVEKTADECGMKLTRFKTDDHLELYYDIKQGRHDLGYISKGWNDPGFRVGEIIVLAKANIPSLKANAFAMLKFCAEQGVSMTIEENANEVDLQMESLIYLYGFNAKVFAQVLDCLNVCVGKARELMK